MNPLDPRILQYQPHIFHDLNEPFPIRALGCMLFETPGRSESFSNLTLDPEREGAQFIIEYAIYYDYDIQHLYDLEHIWVAVDAQGAVCGCWSSFHGMRLCASGVENFHCEGTHPVLYAQPGKHAMLPDPGLFGLHPDFHRACAELCGGGLLVPPMLKGRMTTDDAQDARICRYIRENFAFAPSGLYERCALSDSQFMTWPELLDQIPRMVGAQLRNID